MKFYYRLTDKKKWLKWDKLLGWTLEFPDLAFFRHEGDEKYNWWVNVSKNEEG